uniref:Uncharacterized protein n=1 Tax=Meloidogyne incognita TaxID=6306 RepID=A0A914L9Z1_MELIC
MEVKFYIFLLFCASIKSEVHQHQNDVIEEVNEYLSAFSNLASPMADWLEHLEVAKQTTLDLMKMSGPVSALQGCHGSRKKSGRISGRVFKIFLGSGFGSKKVRVSGLGSGFGSGQLKI